MQYLEHVLNYLITFTKKDADSVPASATDDALVITADAGGFEVRRIPVDNGSSVDVLDYDAFKKMDLADAKLTLINAPLVGFNGGSIYP